MSDPKRTRVLHVLPWVMSGGVERMRLTLARGLPKARFALHVVCMEASSPLVDRLRDEGVGVDVLGGQWAPHDLRTARAVRARIHALEPDIVHAAVFEGISMGTLATLGLGARRPKLVIEEIAYATERSWRGKLLFAAAAARADRCVAVSPSVGRFLVGEQKLPEGWVQVIPNGVEAPKTPSAEVIARARAELGLPEQAFVVGSLGRMHDANKRFSDLVRATALLRDRLPDLVLLLVGGGDDLPRLATLAESLGVKDRVYFAGYREDVGTMYRLMDVFALVSNRESFGLVLAEAMRVELPVVCSGAGGMADVVVDGETGFHVGVGAPERIADALVRLHDEPETRAVMGTKGRVRAEERFSSERYCREVAALYDELIASRRRAGQTAGGA